MLRLTIPGKTSDIGDPQRCNFFIDMLRSSLQGEKELVTLLPVAQQEANNAALKKILAGYLMKVHKQAIRAEEILGILLMQPGGVSESLVKSLLKEIKTLQHAITVNIVNDAILEQCIHKIIRRKIDLYSNLRQLAFSLGMDDAICLLYESLQDEKETRDMITAMAKNKTERLLEA